MTEWYGDYGDEKAAKNEAYWRKKLANQGSISNPAPRSTWERLMDAVRDTIRHYSPAAAGARAIQKSIPIDRDYGVDQKQRRKNIAQEERDWREVRSNYDPADSAGDVAIDLAGGLVGSMVSDPTNLIAPGGSFARQVINQALIGAASDAALQGAENLEGVRDGYDPVQGAISTAAGPALMAVGHGYGRFRTGRSIRRGASDPEFEQLHDTILHLEGGGTLKNPKTSPKGAMGPMQVMPETARDPGFGIRPWNGKTQEDLVRVGRQYAAVMNDRYKGDKAKVLAAYNAGPGRLDDAIAAHGESWLQHMPSETRKYVHDGLKRLSGDTRSYSDYEVRPGEYALNQYDAEGNNQLRGSDFKLTPEGQAMLDRANDVEEPFDAFNTNAFDDGYSFQDKGAGDLHKELQDQLNDPTLPEWRRREIEQGLKDLKNWDSNYGGLNLDELPTYREGVEVDDGHNYHDNSDLDNSLIQIEDDDEFLKAYVEAVGRNPRWVSSDAIQERIDRISERKSTLEYYLPSPDNLSMRHMYTPEHLDSKTMQDAARSMEKFDKNVPDEVRSESVPLEDKIFPRQDTIEEPKSPELIRQLRKSRELRAKFNNPGAEGAYNSLDSRIPSKGPRVARAPSWLRPAESYTDEEWFKLTNPQKLEAIDSANRLEAISRGARNTLGGLIEHPYYGPASRISFSGDDWHRVGWAWDEDGRAFRWIEKSNDGGKTWAVERFAGAQKDPGVFPNKNPAIDAGFDSPKPPKAREIKEAINAALRKFGELWTNEEGAFRPFGRNADGESVPLSELEPERRLTQLLRRLAPMTGEQRRMYHEERSRRASSLSNLQRGEATMENVAQQFGSQRGQLPKKAFESIAEHFDEADFTAMANKINQAPTLLPFQKLKAHEALLNLLRPEGAKLPTPSQIKVLSEVYEPDFIQALLDNRSLLEKVWQNTKSTLNIPRAIMSSMDFSAPFRQGIGLVHKKEFWKALPHMIKMWGSEAASKDWIKGVKSHPRWQLAHDAGLAITDPHTHFLADKEEDFMTDLAERIPFGIGKLIAASNRAYSGFLNKLRWDTFNNLIDQRMDMGETIDPKALKQIGKFVNMATGRGDLGKTGNAAAPALSAMLFSPRLIASRVKTLASPVTYLKADPQVRKEAWKSLLAMSGYYMTIGGLAKYGLGMDVETDPRSPDFMKAKIGNTRYDFMAGYGQYIRLGAQLLTDSTITQRGEEKALTSSKRYKDDTRRDVAIRFFLNKLAPAPGLVSDWMEGSDPTGKDFTWTHAIASRMAPMASQDIADAIQEWGPKGAAMGLPGLVGWSVQTYSTPAKENKRSKPFGDYGESFSKPEGKKWHGDYGE